MLYGYDHQGAQVSTPGHRYDSCVDCKVAQRVRNRKYYQSHKSESVAYAREWALRNPEKRREVQRRSNQKTNGKKLEFVREIVGGTCVDCGENRMAAIEYHHPSVGHEGQPSFISRSWPVLKEEVMRVIALCGTCHNLRHRALKGA